MIPFLVCFGAFVIVFLCAQMGSKAGAFVGLCGMLNTLFSLFVALRYWFISTRWLAGHDDLPVAALGLVAFWIVFGVVAVIFLKVRMNMTDVFESVVPSLIDRILGGIFGLVGGLAFTGAVMMTLTLLAPSVWPAYNSANLPLAIDRWPLQTYRFIETRVAGIAPTEAGHTPLPSLDPKNAGTPMTFWK
jgi:hypothetical protein